MPEEVAAACGVRLGADYPYPIVDHREARQAALAFFAPARRA
jgi:deoxyribodipyrimidine photo-lyase